MPKFVSLNKPSTNTKNVVLVIIVLLILFTIVYAMKMLGKGTWLVGRTEGFEEQNLPWTVKLIYSDTCPHCVAFKPTFEKVATEATQRFPGVTVTFKKTPAAEATEYAQYVSDGIPAVLFIKGEEKPENVQPTKSLVGNMAIDDFATKVKERLV